MQEILVGDVVFLRSGGPKMVVTEINYQKVSTIWFVDGLPTPQLFTFPIECLWKFGAPGQESDGSSVIRTNNQVSSGYRGDVRTQYSPATSYSASGFIGPR